MHSGELLVFGVSEFVAYVNQTLEMAYPYVTIVGEVSSFRVSRGKWVYFDIKDETALVRCFTTVYALGGPLEDGMVVKVSGSPKLHPLYNFSFTVQSVTAVGEGALQRQADLLRAKLTAEGLFDAARKRLLPQIPRRAALLASKQSAAYADFIKIAKARWGGVVIDHYEVQVQGESAPSQIVQAITQAGVQTNIPDVLVLIRGGGSAEDRAAFNDERVVRAVATSRVPTLVAIGHEVDTSLAELAADVRASTPSNAAELLFPDRGEERERLEMKCQQIDTVLNTFIVQKNQYQVRLKNELDTRLRAVQLAAKQRLLSAEQLLLALDPRRPLGQGYAFVRGTAGVVRNATSVNSGDMIEVEFIDGKVQSQVKKVKLKGKE